MGKIVASEVEENEKPFSYKEIYEASNKEPYYISHRKFLAEIKKIQKSHLDPIDLKNPKAINKDWEKFWLPYIKYDHEWDYGYMLDMLIYKLEIMQTRFKFFCSHVDQEKIVTEIGEAIKLGKKIQDRDNYNYYHEYSQKHSDSLAFIYKRKDVSKKATTMAERLDDRGELLATIKMPKDDEFNLKRILYKRYKSPVDKYLKEHNLKEYKDVVVAYGGKWHHKWQHRVWKHLIKKSNRAYTKDKYKFFKIIADHMEGWWD